MMSCTTEKQQVICAVLAEDCKNWYGMPSDTELSVFETAISVLMPVSSLANALSSEEQVIISAIYLIQKHITILAGALRSNSTELSWQLVLPFLDPTFRDQFLYRVKQQSMRSVFPLSQPLLLLWCLS